MPRRRHMWGGTRTRGVKAAVTSSSIPMPKTKSRRKCAACGVHLEVGEDVVRLRLKKQYQLPCSVCSHKPAKLKFFHASCAPADINKAMGYDRNAVLAAGGTPPTTAAPPPKPMSAADASLAALAAIDKAVGRKLAENRALQQNPEFQAAFKKYQGCKTHALRGSNDTESASGLKLALKRVIDLVF